MIGIFTLWKLNQVVKIVDFSSIKIDTKDGLSKDNVLVKKGFYSINRENDNEIFANTNVKVVFDGSDDNLRTEYGENDFLITYQNKYYFQFRNFVFDDNESVQYHFNLFKRNNQIFLKISISPGREFEHKMNLISEAKNLRCNSEINSNKGVYDGVNLH